MGAVEEMLENLYPFQLTYVFLGRDVPVEENQEFDFYQIPNHHHVILVRLRPMFLAEVANRTKRMG